jgi:hypothetical protein
MAHGPRKRCHPAAQRQDKRRSSQPEQSRTMIDQTTPLTYLAVLTGFMFISRSPRFG